MSIGSSTFPVHFDLMRSGGLLVQTKRPTQIPQRSSSIEIVSKPLRSKQAEPKATGADFITQ